MKYILLTLAFSSSLCANPQNPEVVLGKADFSQKGSELSIHTDEKAIIEWENFSIREDEVTEFFQPSSDSIVLNRVCGTNGSEILGRLQANGSVYLINPLGILFGKDSKVDVGGLIASTLDLQDGDFEQGKWHFFGLSEEEIKNEGLIESSGNIFLLGKKIENLGTISVSSGIVSLIGTNEVVIQLDGESPIFYRSSLEDLQGLSISEFPNNSGHDMEVVEENGTIYVRTPSDVLQKGSIVNAGSDVYILGDQIDLYENSTIDVSSEKDAGSVYIGGYQGNYHSEFANLGVKVEKGAEILSYSKDDGDGGKVMIFSQGGTLFEGVVFARGGPNGGNGGKVQIVGMEGLNFLGHVDIFAPNGLMGSFFTSSFIQIR